MIPLLSFWGASPCIQYPRVRPASDDFDWDEFAGGKGGNSHGPSDGERIPPGAFAGKPLNDLGVYDDLLEKTFDLKDIVEAEDIDILDHYASELAFSLHDIQEDFMLFFCHDMIGALQRDYHKDQGWRRTFKTKEGDQAWYQFNYKVRDDFIDQYGTRQTVPISLEIKHERLNPGWQDDPDDEEVFQMMKVYYNTKSEPVMIRLYQDLYDDDLDPPAYDAIYFCDPEQEQKILVYASHGIESDDDEVYNEPRFRELNGIEKGYELAVLAELPREDDADK